MKKHIFIISLLNLLWYTPSCIAAERDTQFTNEEIKNKSFYLAELQKCSSGWTRYTYTLCTPRRYFLIDCEIETSLKMEKKIIEKIRKEEPSNDIGSETHIDDGTYYCFMTKWEGYQKNDYHSFGVPTKYVPLYVSSYVPSYVVPLDDIASEYKFNYKDSFNKFEGKKFSFIILNKKGEVTLLRKDQINKNPPPTSLLIKEKVNDLNINNEEESISLGETQAIVPKNKKEYLTMKNLIIVMALIVVVLYCISALIRRKRLKFEKAKKIKKMRYKNSFPMGKTKVRSPSRI